MQRHFSCPPVSMQSTAGKPSQLGGHCWEGGAISEMQAPMPQRAVHQLHCGKVVSCKNGGTAGCLGPSAEGKVLVGGRGARAAATSLWRLCIVRCIGGWSPPNAVRLFSVYIKHHHRQRPSRADQETNWLHQKCRALPRWGPAFEYYEKELLKL